MDGDNYLYALVEAGVALAGFSAIAIALESRGVQQSETRQKAVIARLVERSLMASLFALLPTLLFGLDISERIVWLIASGSLAGYGAFRLVQTLRTHKETMVQMRVGGATRFVLGLVAVAVIIIQVLNAIGFVLSQGQWWYALGVTWLMVTAGYTFVIYLRAWMRGS
ncbi:MAG TPA: hypothetical protein VD737_03600 [Steroidobacteraceae bacterium]|nr:hypothetical protein [Steroidobacteraceae bacterium]